jgi:O-antigen/teichoic acid export membrane protein
MSRLHRFLFFSAGDRYGSLAFLLFSIAILSRLLTPEEFGIYTTIAALTGLANALREFGGANYIIQKSTLSQQNVRTAFTITFCMSAVLAGLFFVLGDVIAGFFSQEALREGIAVSALNFLLSPFSLTVSALLRREMAFGALARCNLAANFVTAVISVGLAALGYSFMGPVWGSVGGNLTLVALLIACRRDFRIFLPCFRECRDVIAFGAYSSATIIINVFYQYWPQLILSRTLGFTAVGFYGRAVNVTQVFDKLVIDVLHPVLMPVISAQTRAGTHLKPTFLSAIELITAVHWPFLLFAAVMAEPIVWIVFGSQWNEIVPLVRMLCLASLSMFAACLTYPVLIAIGRVRDTLVATLISVPPSLLLIFIASFFGVQAVAASAFLTLPLQVIIALYFVSRNIKISLLDVFRATRKSAVVALGSTAGAIVAVVINYFSGPMPIVALLVATILALAGWYVSLAITRHPLSIHIMAAVRGIQLSIQNRALFSR